jgi:hypothetical protein
MLTEFDRDSTEKDIRRRLLYYTWNDDFQFRAFKFYPGTTINEHGGHFPTFPLQININVSPNKFVLRHYRFRGYEHGMKDLDYFVVDSKKLTQYGEDGRWNFAKQFDPSFGAWKADGSLSLITILHRKLDERTEWALRLDREVKEKDEKILKLQKEFDERTEWAVRFGRDVKEKDEVILKLRKDSYETRERIRKLEEQCAAKDAKIKAFEWELNEIRTSYGYKLARFYGRIIDRVWRRVETSE